ncbi:hypothetical protein RV17_GL002491 [Enterococcus thailandicus]|nr:hypothetical protein RV17_GL002491 [Enterococcus thailandicus]
MFRASGKKSVRAKIAGAGPFKSFLSLIVLNEKKKGLGLF